MCSPLFSLKSYDECADVLRGFELAGIVTPLGGKREQQYLPWTAASASDKTFW